MLNNIIYDLLSHVNCFLSYEDVKSLLFVNKYLHTAYSTFVTEARIRISDIDVVARKVLQTPRSFYPNLKKIIIASSDIDMISEDCCHTITHVLAKHIPHVCIILSHDIRFNQALLPSVCYTIHLGEFHENALTTTFLQNLITTHICDIHLYENIKWYIDEDKKSFWRLVVASNKHSIKIYVHDFSDPIMYLCVNALFICNDIKTTVIVKDDVTMICGLLAKNHFDKLTPDMIILKCKDGYAIPSYIKTASNPLELIMRLPVNIQQKWYWLFMP